MGFWETLKSMHQAGMAEVKKDHQKQQQQNKNNQQQEDDFSSSSSLCGMDDGSHEWYLANRSFDDK